MSEKFTEADVYGTNDNDEVVDDGHFIPTEKGGFASDTGEICKCKTREEHIEHIRRIFPLEKHLYYKKLAELE